MENTDIQRLRNLVKSKITALAVNDSSILDVDPINNIIHNVNRVYRIKGFESKIRELSDHFVFKRENVDTTDVFFEEHVSSSERFRNKFTYSNQSDFFTQHPDYLKKFPSQSLASANATMMSMSNPQIPETKVSYYYDQDEEDNIVLPEDYEYYYEDEDEDDEDDDEYTFN